MPICYHIQEGKCRLIASNIDKEGLRLVGFRWPEVSRLGGISSDTGCVQIGEKKKINVKEMYLLKICVGCSTGSGTNITLTVSPSLVFHLLCRDFFPKQLE